MANLIGRGVEEISGCVAKLRTVPEVSAVCEATEDTIPSEGAPYVSLEEFKLCDGLVIGSPTRFGNMAAPLKYFIDTTSSLWLSGAMNGKPAGVFTSTSTMHGGQESTLLSMTLPLLHHGMVITGIPFTEPELHHSTTGGSPYGATHFNGNNNDKIISEDEKKLCLALGRRVAGLAIKLRG
jgi:NAD(P)H dehydrogenase (quinone)